MLSKLQVRNTRLSETERFFELWQAEESLSNILFRSSCCPLQNWLFLKISQYSQKNSYLGVKKNRLSETERSIERWISRSSRSQMLFKIDVL